MAFVLPRVYPILDSSVIPAERVAFLSQLGRSLADAGVTLLEYRNKLGSDAEILADARQLREAMPAGQVWLILDDRPGLALAAGFDGAHVDAGDATPAEARRVLGAAAVIGTSAGSEAELLSAISEPVDYIAFGPIFPTTTKKTFAAPLGVAGVRRFRELAPDAMLVAAAGITLETAPLILAAGADAVASSAAIFRHANPAVEFRRWLKTLA